MADDIARQAQSACLSVRQAKIAIGSERAEIGDGVVLTQADTARGVAGQREGVDGSAVSLRHWAGDGLGGCA
jgi:hypothetical protein